MPQQGARRAVWARLACQRTTAGPCWEAAAMRRRHGWRRARRPGAPGRGRAGPGAGTWLHRPPVRGRAGVWPRLLTSRPRTTACTRCSAAGLGGGGGGGGTGVAEVAPGRGQSRRPGCSGAGLHPVLPGAPVHTRMRRPWAMGQPVPLGAVLRHQLPSTPKGGTVSPSRIPCLRYPAPRAPEYAPRGALVPRAGPRSTSRSVPLHEQRTSPSPAPVLLIM